MTLSAGFLDFDHLMVILCLLRCFKASDSFRSAHHTKCAPSCSMNSAAEGVTEWGGLAPPKSTECPQATGMTLHNEQKQPTLTFLTSEDNAILFTLCSACRA